MACTKNKLRDTSINKLPKRSCMELNILEESKTKLVFKLKGKTHTFCNLLKAELQKINTKGLTTYK